MRKKKEKLTETETARLTWVGQRVTLLREYWDMTQIDLAKAADVARKVVQQMERGHRVKPDGYIHVAEKLFVAVDEISPERFDDWRCKSYDDLIQHARRRQTEETTPAIPDRGRAVTASNSSNNERQELTAGEVPREWLEHLMCFKSSFCATNYVPRDQIFNQKYAELGRKAQAIQRALGREVRKVLIADDIKEMQGLEVEMRKQAKAGLDVKYIIYREIISDSKLRVMYDGNFSSIDFQVFDDHTILVWNLNEQRRVTGGAVLRGEDDCRVYRNFFQSLFEAAHLYNPKKGVY